MSTVKKIKICPNCGSTDLGLTAFKIPSTLCRECNYGNSMNFGGFFPEVLPADIESFRSNLEPGSLDTADSEMVLHSMTSFWKLNLFWIWLLVIVMVYTFSVLFDGVSRYMLSVIFIFVGAFFSYVTMRAVRLKNKL
jgi:hypothetical protein